MWVLLAKLQTLMMFMYAWRLTLGTFHHCACTMHTVTWVPSNCSHHTTLTRRIFQAKEENFHLQSGFTPHTSFTRHTVAGPVSACAMYRTLPARRRPGWRAYGCVSSAAVTSLLPLPVALRLLGGWAYGCVSSAAVMSSLPLSLSSPRPIIMLSFRASSAAAARRASSGSADSLARAPARNIQSVDTVAVRACDSPGGVHDLKHHDA